MPEQQPITKVKWNEVTWYSKLGAIILFVGVVPALSFYFGTQYELALRDMYSTAQTTHNYSQKPITQALSNTKSAFFSPATPQQTKKALEQSLESKEFAYKDIGNSSSFCGKVIVYPVNKIDQIIATFSICEDTMSHMFQNGDVLTLVTQSGRVWQVNIKTKETKKLSDDGAVGGFGPIDITTKNKVLEINYIASDGRLVPSHYAKKTEDISKMYYLTNGTDSLVHVLDRSSFRVLTEDYAMDSRAVYFQGKVVMDADPKTFVIIWNNPNYDAQDIHNKYLNGGTK